MLPIIKIRAIKDGSATLNNALHKLLGDDTT